jgi:hypothetical protein
VDGGVAGFGAFLSFNLAFGGTLFTLGDIVGQGAWFVGDTLAPEPDLFAGLEVSGVKGGDSIALTPSFGPDSDEIGMFKGWAMWAGTRVPWPSPVLTYTPLLSPTAPPPPSPSRIPGSWAWRWQPGGGGAPRQADARSPPLCPRGTGYIPRPDHSWLCAPLRADPSRSAPWGQPPGSTGSPGDRHRAGQGLGISRESL